MPSTKLPLFAMLIGGLLATTSQAATISYKASIQDDDVAQISGWKTTSTPKAIDGDLDNEFGTLAHVMWRVQGKNQSPGVPTGVWQFNGSQNQVGPFGGYALVDNPLNPAGPDIQVRTTTSGNVAQGSEQNMFTWTATANMPANVRIGIAVDGLDGSRFSPSGIGIEQVGGSKLVVDNLPVNNTLDMYFFDVEGIQAGDQFRILGLAGRSTPGFGFATNSFVTWDTLDANADTGVDAADVWNVDIQGAGGRTPVLESDPGALGGGGRWNAFNVNHHAGTSTNPSQALLDSAGNATGVTLSLNGTMSGFNNAPGGAGSELTSDYLFINAGNADATVGFELSGLISGATYDLLMLAGGINGRDFNMLLDTNGDLSLLDETAINVSDEGRLFASVLASSDGRILGTFLNDGHEGNVAGFQLRLVSAPVPEPTTAVLLATGVLGLATRRRRRA